MKHAQPLLGSATYYRIELHGHVDVEWLQGFDSSVEIVAGEDGQMPDITVLTICTDQSGIVGLVRRLHGLGITIQQVRIIQP